MLKYNAEYQTRMWYLIASVFCIIWTLPLVLTSLIGVQLYKITGQTKRNLYQHVSWQSILENNEPVGWIIGTRAAMFIGYVEKVTMQNSENSTLYVLMRRDAYARIFQNEAVADNSRGKITLYEREGEYFRIRYTPRDITVRKQPTDLQSKLVTLIINSFTLDENNNSVNLIYGPPGTGKSMLAMLLCKELAQIKNQVNVVRTFNPTEPGNSFSELYGRVNPTFDKPLVLVLEEVDQLLTSVHKKEIPIHKFIPIQIRNKIGWDAFFDDFDRGFFSNVITIMTTNESPSYFDNMDPAYMRRGRFHNKFELLTR